MDPSDEITAPGLPPEVGALPPGARFGKFARTAVLGTGGMGQVWKAYDTDLGRWVALKFLKSAEPEQIERFRREARMAGGLSHPNIAAIYEFGETDGHHWIAMQFVPGRTLRIVPRADRKILVRLIRDAARGVGFAHQKGIIHRDLKPDNLMATGPDLRVFVMDFGFARVAEGASGLSQSGFVVGTPSYMAPEQSRGEHVDARVDVWGLGATLYELITDRRPFAATALPDLFRSIQEDDPRRPRSIDPKIDADLETILLKCLEKDPDRRYSDASKLADDLDRWLEGKPIAARPASMVYRARKWTSRHRWLVIVSAAGILATISVAALLLPKWFRAEAAFAGERGKREELEVFVPLEAKLNLLRMNFYRPDYRLTREELAHFDQVSGAVRDQMKRSGPNATGWYLVGRCMEVVGTYEEADAAYAEALKINSSHARALLARGRLGIEQSLYRRSSHHTSEARKIRDVAVQMGILIEQGLQVAGPDVEMEADLARAYLEMIRTWHGEKTFEADPMVKKWGSRPFVEEFLFVEALNQAERASGILKLDKVQARFPSYAPIFFWRAVARIGLQQHEAAIGDFTRAVEINPRFSEAYVGRGLCLERRGDLDGAMADYDRGIELRPGYAYAYLNRAGLLHQRGKNVQAMADCHRAIEVDSQCAAAYNTRGGIREALGELAPAVEDFDTSISFEPDYAEAHANRAKALEGLDKLGEARDAANRALEFNPHLALAYRTRGIVSYRLQDKESALRDFDKALEIEPRQADALYYRGVIRQDRREFDLAIADYTSALAIFSRYPEALANRGTILDFKRDLPAAIRDYEKALEVAPAEWPYRSRIEGQLTNARARLQK